jgi:Glyoxalase/Bleomycin resistance protein/Dioxygenase superfamily
MTKIKKFLLDFGMHVVQEDDNRIYFRGYGPDQYVYICEKSDKPEFRGGCFETETREDLNAAAKKFGVEVKKINAPGGGYKVTIADPDGFPLHLIHGQTPAETGKLPEKIVSNFPSADDKPRKGTFLRFQPGPASVHKLGHFGVNCTDFNKTFEFYCYNFTFKPSDILYTPDGRDVAGFFHLDRGETFVDHHSFFVQEKPPVHVHHCSFEIHDFDTQLLGHQWLEKQGYKLSWGVGRHILGSQIFDYWYDVHGFMIEHYADGDLVNAKNPIGRNPAEDEMLYVWGPDVPSTFLD